jgi:hypothetical protein
VQFRWILNLIVDRKTLGSASFNSLVWDGLVNLLFVRQFEINLFRLEYAAADFLVLDVVRVLPCGIVLG